MTTPPREPRPDLTQRTVTWMRREYEDSDDLLLDIAEQAHGTRCQAAHLYSATSDDAILASQIITAATTRIEQWRTGQPAPGLGAMYAAADSLAAILIRDWAPSIAEHLTHPWDTAVLVREQLRDLGERAEPIAIRLLPTWHSGDLEEMPEVVAGLIESTRSP